MLDRNKLVKNLAKAIMAMDKAMVESESGEMENLLALSYSDENVLSDNENKLVDGYIECYKKMYDVRLEMSRLRNEIIEEG